MPKGILFFCSRFGENENPSGFRNWQRGENEIRISFSTSEPIPGGFLSAPSSPAHYKQKILGLSRYLLFIDTQKEDLNAETQISSRKFGRGGTAWRF
jgi:hypothetical protein